MVLTKFSVTQCDFMLKSNYIPPDNSDPYACNTYDLADGYIFKILDLNITTRDSHQCRNVLERFHKRDHNGESFIIDRHRILFLITSIYDTTTHTGFYCQVEFHKLSSKYDYDLATMFLLYNSWELLLVVLTFVFKY